MSAMSEQPSELMDSICGAKYEVKEDLEAAEE